MANTTWSLCLVSSSLAAGSNRKFVKVNPDTDSVGDLFRIAGEAFGVASVVALKTGFPPQLLNASDGTPLSASKQVGNQELVQVFFGSIETATEKEEKRTEEVLKQVDTKSRAETDRAGEATTRRSKRAASQAATDSFADVIKEQNRLMKAETKRQPKKAKKAATASTCTIPKPKRAPSFTSKEPGRRLGDGAVIGTPSKSNLSPSKSSSRTRTSKQSSTPGLPADQKRHEDMSTALLETLNHTGTGGKILRKTMKSAVENSYENTKAVARLAALQSRNPPESVIMERIQDDTKLRVQFEKGVQGRGYYEDIVDWIPTEVLTEVLRAILKSNPENLRPQNLALLSPRFLWALAYRHWETQTSKINDQETPSPWEPFSVEKSYRQLMPDRQDWAFLRRRKQILSAKAMENLRQQQESAEISAGDNYEEAAAAIQDVEMAMGQLQSYDRAQRLARVANAALARQLKQQARPGEAVWKIVTPSDHDEEELLECIGSSGTPLKDPEDATKIANLLVTSGSAHNWRELANCDASSLRSQISENATSLDYVTEEQVADWVDYARLQTLEEIMVEVCDGSVSHVQLLRDCSHANTPKDLVSWGAMPDLLLEELGHAAAGKVTVEDLARFCNHARLALDQFEWLTWYVTSVE